MFDWFRKEKAHTIPLKLPDVVICRGDSTEQGTFGVLRAKGNFSCKVCELPDRGNEKNYSRIPAGSYNCRPYHSERFGSVYIVEEVKGRSYILAHSGNLAGDSKRGLRTHSAGCILLGKYFGKLNGQKAVLCSRPVVRSFVNLMGGKPFIFEIKEV